MRNMNKPGVEKIIAKPEGLPVSNFGRKLPRKMRERPHFELKQENEIVKKGCRAIG